MSHERIIRAWKDAEYRQSLSQAERAILPAHPAGVIELEDTDLERAGGALFGTRLTCETHCFCSWFGQCPSQGPCNPSINEVCPTSLR